MKKSHWNGGCTKKLSTLLGFVEGVLIKNTQLSFDRKLCKFKPLFIFLSNQYGNPFFNYKFFLKLNIVLKYASYAQQVLTASSPACVS